MPADRAVEWLRALADTWQEADVAEAKSQLLHAIYERIVVAGREFVGAQLTPAAYANGLALALPEQVVSARPTGFGFPDAIPVAKRILIRGADAWRALVESRTA